MYDPMTVAFSIRYPWRKYSRAKARSKFDREYREEFICIWHVDPERAGRGNRTDDSCGWFTPPTTEEQRAKIQKLGEEQFSWLFRKREQMLKGDPEKYAHICYEPDTYAAVYWAWRAIKREDTKHVWQYGGEGRYLTLGELERIQSLASNPVDNLQSTVMGVQSREDCAHLFQLVYSAYLRYNRPWYRKPRWHFWHWKVQVRPLESLKRWLWTRCCRCGNGFAWDASVTTSNWNSTGPLWGRSERGVYHDSCEDPLCKPRADAKPEITH